MQQKGKQEITIDEFTSLLARIDDQIVKQHNAMELAHLTRPIFEFLLLGEDVTGREIPVKALIVFFEDKKLSVLRDYIERICRIRGTDHLTIDQLAGIIADLHSGTDTAARPTTWSSQPPPASQPVPEPDLDEHADSAPQTNTAETAGAGQGADQRNIALSLTFSGMAESMKGVPLAFTNLQSSISDEQRERFVNSIFRNDQAYYTVVVESLNTLPTWRDASLYLQTFYQTSGIDPYSQEAVEFTDIVQHHFSPTQQTPP